jgi:hypothetical protein
MTVAEPIAHGSSNSTSGTRVVRDVMRILFSQSESMNCKKGNPDANQR